MGLLSGKMILEKYGGMLFEVDEDGII